MSKKKKGKISAVYNFKDKLATDSIWCLFKHMKPQARENHHLGNYDVPRINRYRILRIEMVEKQPDGYSGMRTWR